MHDWNIYLVLLFGCRWHFESPDGRYRFSIHRPNKRHAMHPQRKSRLFAMDNLLIVYRSRIQSSAVTRMSEGYNSRDKHCRLGKKKIRIQIKFVRSFLVPEWIKDVQHVTFPTKRLIWSEFQYCAIEESKKIVHNNNVEKLLTNLQRELNLNKYLES